MKKRLLSSRLVSLFLGLLVGGFYGWTIIARVLSSFNNEILLIHNIFGAILLGGALAFMGFKLPRLTEVFIAGFSILIILQAIWDFGVFDWSQRRAVLLIGSVIILFLDMIIGTITWREVGKIGKRQLGAS